MPPSVRVCRMRVMASHDFLPAEPEAAVRPACPGTGTGTLAAQPARHRQGSEAPAVRRRVTARALDQGQDQGSRPRQRASSACSDLCALEGAQCAPSCSPRLRLRCRRPPPRRRSCTGSWSAPAATRRVLAALSSPHTEHIVSGSQRPAGERAKLQYGLFLDFRMDHVRNDSASTFKQATCTNTVGAPPFCSGSGGASSQGPRALPPVPPAGLGAAASHRVPLPSPFLCPPGRSRPPVAARERCEAQFALADTCCVQYCGSALRAGNEYQNVAPHRSERSAKRMQRPVVQLAALPGHARARRPAEGAALPNTSSCAVRLHWNPSLTGGVAAISSPCRVSAHGPQATQDG